jgi:replicative DNA helicase
VIKIILGLASAAGTSLVAAGIYEALPNMSTKLAWLARHLMTKTMRTMVDPYADVLAAKEELKRGNETRFSLFFMALSALTLAVPRLLVFSISNAARTARAVREIRRDVAAGKLNPTTPSTVCDVVERQDVDSLKPLSGGEINTTEPSTMSDVACHGTDSLKPLRELLAANLDHLEAVYNRGNTIAGLSTGFTDLDELLSGLQPNSLVIVGGRPTMGKTSFALGVAAHVAIEKRQPVLFASLEMSHLEISQRLLSSEARVDSHRIRNGRLYESDWPKVVNAVGKLASAPLFIDDDPNLSVLEIRDKARRLKTQEGLGLIIIDYLQLVSPIGRCENRQVEVSEISRGLKILAREMAVPILALSAVSRNVDTRADKRPLLADLRESGSLAEDADVVLFVYRDEAYNKDSLDKGMAEIIVAKHRNGPSGVIRLAFLGWFARFANLARV